MCRPSSADRTIGVLCTLASSSCIECHGAIPRFCKRSAWLVTANTQLLVCRCNDSMRARRCFDATLTKLGGNEISFSESLFAREALARPTHDDAVAWAARMWRVCESQGDYRRVITLWADGPIEVVARARKRSNRECVRLSIRVVRSRRGRVPTNNREAVGVTPSSNHATSLLRATVEPSWFGGTAERETP